MVFSRLLLSAFILKVKDRKVFAFVGFHFNWFAGRDRKHTASLSLFSKYSNRLLKLYLFFIMSFETDFISLADATFYAVNRFEQDQFYQHIFGTSTSTCKIVWHHITPVSKKKISGTICSGLFIF